MGDTSNITHFFAYCNKILVVGRSGRSWSSLSLQRVYHCEKVNIETVGAL